MSESAWYPTLTKAAAIVRQLETRKHELSKSDRQEIRDWLEDYEAKFTGRITSPDEIIIMLGLLPTIIPTKDLL